MLGLPGLVMIAAVDGSCDPVPHACHCSYTRRPAFRGRRAVIAIQPGTTAEQAVAQMRRTVQEAANVAGASAGRTPIQVVEHYLRWAEDAERMLTNVLDVSLVSEILHTTRYWSLRTSRSDDLRLTPTVLVEMESRRQHLERLVKELDLEQQRWSGGSATIVIPDTNTFLREGEPFEGINWPTVLRSDVEVRLVVPLVVIHELDRLKRQGNSATAKLARAALRWLNSTLPDDPAGRSAPLSTATPIVTIEAYPHDGPARPADADEVIIEVTRWLGIVAGLPTMLVTRDLGMRIRSRAAGVEARHLLDPGD